MPSPLVICSIPLLVFAPTWAWESPVPYSFADRRPLVARSTDRVEGPAKAGGPRR